MKHLRFIFRYIKFWFNAGNAKGHGIHSPFVYKLITEVLNDKRHFYSFQMVEMLRSSMLRNEKEIKVTDLGAGSVRQHKQKRKVKDIAKHAAKSKKWGSLLFRLIQYFQPQTGIELGTSLGISTMYQALALPSMKLISIEGCPETAAIAKQNLENYRINNVELWTGNFDTLFPEALKHTQKLDYAFIDGNHRKEPTLLYFEQCLPFIHNDSVLIFDDIYWSAGMMEAWQHIKNHSRVTLTIDLFYIGLVFFRREQKEKEHFRLKV